MVLTGFAFAADVANALDEFTQSQGPLPVIGFHGRKRKPGNRAAAMGCYPTEGECESNPGATAAFRRGDA